MDPDLPHGRTRGYGSKRQNYPEEDNFSPNNCRTRIGPNQILLLRVLLVQRWSGLPLRCYVRIILTARNQIRKAIN